MAGRVTLFESSRNLRRFSVPLLIIGVMLATVGEVNGQEIEWAKQFGAFGSVENVAQAVDSNGNIYVAGQTRGSLPGQSNAGGSDAFIRKYNADGMEQWTQQFGSSGTDCAYGVAADSSGIYVVGNAFGSLPGKTALGSSDAFVRKYDSSGAEQWTRQFGTSATDFAYGVVADGLGVYVVGSTTGSLSGQSNMGGSDAFVRKYDTSGAEQWTQQFGPSSNAVAYGVATEGSAVYVVGASDGTFPDQSSAGGSDAFIRKYDASGVEQWTRQFGGSGPDYAYGVAAGSSGIYVVGSYYYDAFIRKYDAAGNEQWTHQLGLQESVESSRGVAVDNSGVYMVGRTNGSLPGQSNAGWYDAFINKYDEAGTEQWTHQFGTTLAEYANGVAADGSGVYLVGAVYAVLPGSATPATGDVLVRRYDPSGNLQWNLQFGTTGATEETARAIAFDGNIYLVGSTWGVLAGEQGLGGADAFIGKYDATGVEQWIRQFGTSGSDYSYGVAVASSGIYVVGYTSGSFPDHRSVGGDDAFIRKYDDAGTEQWTRQFGASSYDRARGVAADNSGVYVVGCAQSHSSSWDDGCLGLSSAFVRKYDAGGSLQWTREIALGDFGASALGVATSSSGVYVVGSASPSGSTIPDAFIRKYDSGGTEQWTRQFGTTWTDYAYGVAADSSGAYVVGVTNVVPTGQSMSVPDAFIRKFSSGGVEQWGHQFGTSASDYAYGVANGNSGVYVVGSTSGGFPGQNPAGGASDAFIRKYDAAGSDLWTRQFGTTTSDAAYGVSTGGSGVYVVGRTLGGFPGAPTSGNPDAFLVKYLENVPPDLGALPAVQKQYGDGLSVAVSATDPNDPLGSLVFSAINLPAGLSLANNGDGTATISGAISVPAGNYNTQVTVTDPQGASDSGLLQFLVTREDAFLGYAGDSLIRTGRSTTLRASVTEAADGSLGDITKARVFFDLAGSLTGAVNTFGPAAPSASGEATWTLAPDLQPDVYVVTVRTDPANGYYYAPNTEAVLAVYDPEAGFTTGAGWVDDGGEKASLGFSVKYQGKQDNVQGQAVYMYRSGGTLTRVKSNAMQWMVVQGNSVVFRGKATVNGSGNHTFEMTAVDNNEQGKGDTFGLKVWDSQGTLVHESSAAGLEGGNIVVPHTVSSATATPSSTVTPTATSTSTPTLTPTPTPTATATPTVGGPMPMQVIYDAVRLENMRTARTTYSRGESPYFDFDLANRSSLQLQIPLNSSHNCYLVGIEQHWVERLGPNKEIPSISSLISRDSAGRYADGGALIVSGSTWAPGVVVTRSHQEIHSTAQYPAGSYRYYTEYRTMEGQVLQSAYLDVTYQ